MKEKIETGKCIGCKKSCEVEVPEYVTGYFIVCSDCQDEDALYQIKHEEHAVYVTAQKTQH